MVWHTQGSGKSMEMELYANLVLRSHPPAQPDDRGDHRPHANSTGSCSTSFAASTLLPEQPIQIRTRAQLRTELTQRSSGGILFTTLQKFNRTPAGAGVRAPTTRC